MKYFRGIVAPCRESNPAQGAPTIRGEPQFAALQNPLTAPPTLYSGVDIFGTTQFSFPVIFDSGASGNLLSNFSQTTLHVPLTGETYSDVGIGGTEIFNVTPGTRLLLAPNSVGEAGADDITNFTAIGNYKFQAKQQDVNVGGFDMPFDIVGTPVLNQKVMHVVPNTTEFHTDGPYIDYMHSELLNTMPTKLASKGVFKIPLKYKNFVTLTSPPVTVDTNPTIQNVQVIDPRKPGNQQSAAQDWLLDTGGSVTIIGRNYATSIGINLATETPTTTVDVFGVGNVQRTLNGYVVQQLRIPLGNGDTLVYDNATVFVPADANTLPADLGGILGVNLLAPAFSMIDPNLGTPSDITASRYSDWYLDGPGHQLVLVDPNSTYAPTPEPTACVWLGAALVLMARCRRSRAITRCGLP